MAEAKFINSKSFTATNTLCSAATVTVFVLFLSVAHGENLTTLDGKTFTNITEVTKYPNQVFFTYNEKRTVVAISNLPAEFLTKFGIKIQNPSSAFPSPQPTNPVDLFLWQNLTTDLYESEYDYFTTNDWHKDSMCTYVSESRYIRLHGAEVSLEANYDNTYYYSSDKSTDKGKPVSFSINLNFKVGQELLIAQMFDWFLEWEAIAAKNHAEKFEKEITKDEKGEGFGIYFFAWDNGRASLRNVYGGEFTKDDVVYFQTHIKHLPEMKEKLAERIRNKEAQKGLFK